MILNPLWRWLGQPQSVDASAAPSGPPLPYSWILTNQLAIGPRPITPFHWQQLEEAGLRGRFSCCYPEEEEKEMQHFPLGWANARVSLPDHRQQEILQVERLIDALTTADQLIDQGGPIYLHCLAGIERSPLLAVGLTARRRKIDLYEALDWVRRCHPVTFPLYEHLELMEQVLRT